MHAIFAYCGGGIATARRCDFSGDSYIRVYSINPVCAYIRLGLDGSQILPNFNANQISEGCWHGILIIVGYTIKKNTLTLVASISTNEFIFFTKYVILNKKILLSLLNY